MGRCKTYHRKKCLFLFLFLLALLLILAGRLIYLMLFQNEHYSKLALDLHQRERQIKAARGIIYDRNGVKLASNSQVCTISVIHSQITEAEKVIDFLSEKLSLSKEEVKKKVEKVSSREKIKSNVKKEIADEIREAHLDGVKVDEDYKRYYPFGTLASKVLGFCGSDNQGIVGLEVTYEDILSGEPGKILTLTDYKGIEIENAAEERVEPIDGKSLYLSIDVNIQKYAEQASQKVMKQKEAIGVSMILLNPQNGEIYAMVDLPEYDLNDPFTLTEGSTLTATQDQLNQMWRNSCINDTYEPGSTFKIVTAAAALSEGVVSLTDQFSCPGFRIVEDRRIRCHKAGGHGTESFKEGVMNSCNPVFMDVGARLGASNTYQYWRKLGLFETTGVDVPGEAGSIMHKLENIKAVELATMSFGQSFQITPLQLLRAASAVVNGGRLVTPHFGIKAVDELTGKEEVFSYTEKNGAVSEETSNIMKEVLEAVVSEGTGKNAAIEGYRIGGKTATSQKLPRSEHKYISSFLGFAPADNPIIMGIVLIDEPTGIYYGGTIAAPVMKEVFENVLPYLGVKEEYVEKTEEN
ncbi:MAG: penicillin-binding transpeptidase domain-containing protein [Lachnospiraceae bacterium]|nr:penicillin-binding transpeptidase domain-containing protein [Lachnospiraceae bacterium]